MPFVLAIVQCRLPLAVLRSPHYTKSTASDCVRDAKARVCTSHGKCIDDPKRPWKKPLHGIGAVPAAVPTVSEQRPQTSSEVANAPIQCFAKVANVRRLRDHGQVPVHGVGFEVVENMIQVITATITRHKNRRHGSVWADRWLMGVLGPQKRWKISSKSSRFMPAVATKPSSDKPATKSFCMICKETKKESAQMPETDQLSTCRRVYNI